MKRIFFTAVLVVMSYLAAGFSQVPAPLTLQDGRIAISHDGNAWDKDDVFAMAMDWAVIAAFGVQKKLAHIEHSVILDSCNRPDQHSQMIESAKGWKYFPGFDSSVCFDAWAGTNATVAHFKSQAEKSSANDKLYFCLAGPMEVPWRDIQAVSPEKRKFIVAISHSRSNESMGSCITPSHKWSDLKAGFSSNGVLFFALSDQNAALGGVGSYVWNFLDSMPDKAGIPSSAWMWLKGRDFKANGDCSDNVLTWYVLTGRINISYRDAQLRFKDPLLPDNTDVFKPAAGAGNLFVIPVSFTQNKRILIIKANGFQGNGSVRIFNMVSQQVAKAPMVSGQTQVLLGTMPAGKYVAAIELKDRVFTKEFFIH